MQIDVKKAAARYPIKYFKPLSIPNTYALNKEMFIKLENEQFTGSSRQEVH